MKNEGCIYQGILYPGLIITPNGPKVLEFNCRFGDPETQPIMMMLESDLLTVLLSVIEGNLNQQTLIFRDGASVCVVLASGGYPDKYLKGKEILHSIKSIDHNIQVFHAGTKHQNGKVITSGGRVLGVTSFDKNISDSLKKIYSLIDNKEIFFDGMQYRKDIGKKAYRYDII